MGKPSDLIINYKFLKKYLTFIFENRWEVTTNKAIIAHSFDFLIVNCH